jgi:hypothetical protein
MKGYRDGCDPSYVIRLGFTVTLGWNNNLMKELGTTCCN